MNVAWSLSVQIDGNRYPLSFIEGQGLEVLIYLLFNLLFNGGIADFVFPMLN